MHRQFSADTLRSGLLWLTSVAFLAGLLLPGATDRLPAAEIVAHRGASFDAPENTMAAVRLAWEQDADAVEVDIYLSKDGHIVTTHDATPKRFGGSDHPIADSTWEEVQALDVGAWKSLAFAGEKVPDFEEIVKSVPEGRRLFIEIKCGPEILPYIKAVLERTDRLDSRSCIICFNQNVMEAAASEFPELQRYWLHALDRGEEKPPLTATEIVEITRKVQATGVNLGGKTAGLTEDLVKEINAAGFPVFAWTVNDPAEAERLARIGVQGITTDKPALLLEKGIREIAADQP